MRMQVRSQPGTTSPQVPVRAKRRRVSESAEEALSFSYSHSRHDVLAVWLSSCCESHLDPHLKLSDIAQCFISARMPIDHCPCAVPQHLRPPSG
jgi:hypothetical protein